MTAAMFEIRLFGTTSVRTPERELAFDVLTPAKPRQVLEIVALGRGRTVTKPELAESLWEGHPPPSWPTTLEGYVAVLRRLIQPGVPGRATIVRTVAGGYRLDTDRVRLDLDTFDDLTRTGAERGEELARLTAAARLGHRDVLEHERYAAWPVATRAEYQHRAVRAAVDAARRALRADLLDLALELAGGAVARDPLAEDAWQLVIRTHARAGRVADAVVAFRACARRMAEELGLEPGVATRRALADALDTDPIHVTGRAPAASA